MPRWTILIQYKGCWIMWIEIISAHSTVNPLNINSKKKTHLGTPKHHPFSLTHSSSFERRQSVMKHHCKYNFGCMCTLYPVQCVHVYALMWFISIFNWFIHICYLPTQITAEWCLDSLGQSFVRTACVYSAYNGGCIYPLRNR